ncbi:MAG: ABC transporter permease, partial [Oscillospiraceae bacterium]|nr:ABC transporter permease [Oscillospiraceae bacterium]
GTGMRVIKMSPVQAISQRSNTVKKVRRNSLFGLIFGWTGKIASRNNMRQPKRYIATVISLTMSIALFSAVTVVIDNLHGRVDEYYKDRLLNSGDFTVRPTNGSPDPFAYQSRMEILEESGLFSKLYFSIEDYGSYAGKAYYNVWATDSAVLFYNRDKYNQIFDGKPPIPYDELSKSGGYILCGSILDEGNIPKSVSLEYGNWEWITEEEYNELSEEEKLFTDELNINSQYYKYQYYERYRSEFDVFMTLDLETSSVCRLIGTLDQYENGEYAKFKYPNLTNGIVCILANDDNYLKALDLMQQNFRDRGFDEFTDYSTERRQMRSTLSSVNIGAAFFSVLIALIAVVNMVNILSTGILNRRGELAAMQCVGMTEKQLYKMTVIECLQYALTSGIGAVAVCELLLFLTDKMLYLVIDILEYIGYSVNYVEPLPIIGIASLCAFIIAIAASVIPLRAMQKTQLVEQIRSVE